MLTELYSLCVSRRFRALCIQSVRFFALLVDRTIFLKGYKGSPADGKQRVILEAPNWPLWVVSGSSLKLARTAAHGQNRALVAVCLDFRFCFGADYYIDLDGSPFLLRRDHSRT